MDWNRIEGNWKQFKGQAREKWGRLTDDDLDVINGRQDQLEGKIQERYGLAKDQAKRMWKLGSTHCGKAVGNLFPGLRHAQMGPELNGEAPSARHPGGPTSRHLHSQRRDDRLCCCGCCEVAAVVVRWLA
jgi:uncharacterized protein YjbJ (UPF0337 family)